VLSVPSVVKSPQERGAVTNAVVAPPGSRVEVGALTGPAILRSLAIRLDLDGIPTVSEKEFCLRS